MVTVDVRYCNIVDLLRLYPAFPQAIYDVHRYASASPELKHRLESGRIVLGVFPNTQIEHELRFCGRMLEIKR